MISLFRPDDNRFDHRPFLYNVNWHWQFQAIDKRLEQMANLTDEEINKNDVKKTSLERKSSSNNYSKQQCRGSSWTW